MLRALARAIDSLNDRIGRAAAWLAVAMVVLQFVVVVLRYVFSYGSIFMQEGVIYLHAVLFLVGAGYTLMKGGHVRVDILYRGASPRRKALVDMAGTLLLLFPVCGIVAWATLPYVGQSWTVLEGSKETSGIPAVFLLKSSILAFIALLVLQGFATVSRSLLLLLGDEPPPQSDDRGGSSEEAEGL